MKPIVLASGSPRRTEILRTMGIAHRVQVSGVDESKISADHPRTFALRAAYAKARDVAAVVEEDEWVLAADTVVALGPLLFGKPTDAAHARRVLRRLSGIPHQVITGIALCAGKTQHVHLLAEDTQVVFRELTDAEIDAYVETGEPMDKAGAYGIQGKGGDLIERIEGDFYNVVGLPCRALERLFEMAGLAVPMTVPAQPERWR